MDQRKVLEENQENIKQINEMIEIALLSRDDSKYKDLSFEDGVLAALNWVMRGDPIFDHEK